MSRRWKLSVASLSNTTGPQEVEMVAESVAIRRLKDRLTEYVARVRNGDIVVLTDRGAVVARRVPPADDEATRLLRETVSAANIGWQGGKPLGLDRATVFQVGEEVSLARAVVEERE